MHSLRVYGLDEPDVEAFLTAQGGLCAICQCSLGDVQMNIDHCHRTGRVRGLLCSQCNSGIGQLRDDVDLLRAAICYLESEPVIDRWAPEKYIAGTHRPKKNPGAKS